MINSRRDTENDMGRILRSEDIQLAEPLALNDSMRPVSQTPASQDNDQAEVRMIEEHPDYVIIEVVCSCGKKMQIRCNY